jgi:hypothetical protein
MLIFCCLLSNDKLWTEKGLYRVYRVRLFMLHWTLLDLQETTVRVVTVKYSSVLWSLTQISPLTNEMYISSLRPAPSQMYCTCSGASAAAACRAASIASPRDIDLRRPSPPEEEEPAGDGVPILAGASQKRGSAS